MSFFFWFIWKWLALFLRSLSFHLFSQDVILGVAAAFKGWFFIVLFENMNFFLAQLQLMEREIEMRNNQAEWKCNRTKQTTNGSVQKGSITRPLHQQVNGGDTSTVTACFIYLTMESFLLLMTADGGGFASIFYIATVSGLPAPGVTAEKNVPNLQCIFLYAVLQTRSIGRTTLARFPATLAIRFRCVQVIFRLSCLPLCPCPGGW